MARVLYFDCFSGASGDMILGALLDAGLPLAELRSALGSLGLERYEIRADRVDRAGIAATKFRLIEDPEHPRHHHHHGHHDAHEPRGGAGTTVRPAVRHEHRSLAAILALIEQSGLSAAGRVRAGELFRRLAEAEAAIHQTTLDRVHLHEVGALDSIIDIVGAVFALEWFGADRIVASPLNVGSGTVRCEHGAYPVPAPATARLLAGAPVYSSGAMAELVTPTGALLITGYVQEYGPLPAMTIERIGYGAGDLNPAGTPNVLRVLSGTAQSQDLHRRVVCVECEIDDMNPQIFGAVMDRLYEAGALEVFYVPVQMKKNRPGTLVTVVAPPARREAIADVLFRETTTIGLRYQELQRECLERTTQSVETPFGVVRFKLARRGGVVLNASPEFDDCADRAREHGVSIKEVQAVAMKAYLDTKDKGNQE
jgi:uncharacterized protein (TIGR00299 family) protein